MIFTLVKFYLYEKTSKITFNYFLLITHKLEFKNCFCDLLSSLNTITLNFNYTMEI